MHGLIASKGAKMINENDYNFQYLLPNGIVRCAKWQLPLRDLSNPWEFGKGGVAGADRFRRKDPIAGLG